MRKNLFGLPELLQCFANSSELCVRTLDRYTVKDSGKTVHTGEDYNYSEKLGVFVRTGSNEITPVKDTIKIPWGAWFIIPSIKVQDFLTFEQVQRTYNTYMYLEYLRGLQNSLKAVIKFDETYKTSRNFAGSSQYTKLSSHYSSEEQRLIKIRGEVERQFIEFSKSWSER